MTMTRKTMAVLALLSCALLVAAGCAKEQPVSFVQEVKPILDRYCVQCHLPGGEGAETSGFSIATYEELMKGTRNGPMIVPGDPLGSNMLVLMEGRADPSIAMPHGTGDNATEAEIATIRRWIEEGAADN
jgi:hypothetical protein